MHNPEIQKRYLQKISGSASRMTELIKAVLNYSRLPVANQEMALVDLNELLAQIQIDLDLFIAEKQATVQVKNLPQVVGNASQLNQLFSNLFTNSLKFSEAPPQISIYSETLSREEPQRFSQNDKAYTKIIFSDNGIGFDEQFAERVFSIFQRLHSPEKYPGTGIGLALCKKIVDNHGGSITVKSVPGKGTAFTIYLPLLALAD